MPFALMDPCIIRADSLCLQTFLEAVLSILKQINPNQFADHLETSITQIISKMNCAGLSTERRVAYFVAATCKITVTKRYKDEFCFAQCCKLYSDVSS